MPRLIDLTLPLTDGLRGYSWEQSNTVARDGWNARTLHLYSHCGTHMDSPWHFEAGPWTIDQTPLEACMGPAWVVRLLDTQPDELLTVGHVSKVADHLEPGDSLLLNTNWSVRIADAALYRDRLPRIAPDLAAWCVEREVRALGVEAPSVAKISDLEELTEIHRTLLGGGVTIVEGLCNLDQIREERVFFCALPLKVAGGDGSPCRAFAMEGGFGEW